MSAFSRTKPAVAGRARNHAVYDGLIYDSLAARLANKKMVSVHN
jgi:hypothetical protein